MPTNFDLGVRMEWPATPICAVTSKVKGQANNVGSRHLGWGAWLETRPFSTWVAVPDGRSSQKVCGVNRGGTVRIDPKC